MTNTNTKDTATEVVSARRMIAHWDSEIARFRHKKEQGIALTKDEEDRAASVQSYYTRDGFNPAYKTAVDWLGFEAVINKQAETLRLNALTGPKPRYEPRDNVVRMPRRRP